MRSAAALLVACAWVPIASHAGDGTQVFAGRCAVCHQAQASGVPGTFPPLREQVVAFGKIPAGKDYLVMVVTTGLMGEINVGGTRYNNVMPAQSGLSEDEVAEVLNFLAGDLGKADLGGAAMTADDVRSARARHPERTPQSTRALRPVGVP